MSEQQAAFPPHAARDALRVFALTLPGAYEEYPWGQVVAKVRNKVFVFFDGHADDPAFHFSVKLPHTGDDVLTLPFARPAGYGLGKSGWVSFTFEAGEQPPLAMIEPWIVESYRAVAPKRLLAEFDARA